MIYIDPPYNTGNDFVYKDDFKDNLDNYKKITGQVDDDGNKITTNSESDGRYHTNWLNMMYPRLRLARNLLSDDGVIFISIDDNETCNLKKMCDEIFGEENFISNTIWQQGRKSAGKTIAINHEYCLIFAKNIQTILSNSNEEFLYWKKKKEGLDAIYNKVKELNQKYTSNYIEMTKEIRQWYKSIGENHPSYAHKHYNNYSC